MAAPFPEDSPSFDDMMEVEDTSIELQDRMQPFQATTSHSNESDQHLARLSRDCADQIAAIDDGAVMANFSKQLIHDLNQASNAAEAPMQAATGAVVNALTNIDLNDPDKANAQLEFALNLSRASTDVADNALRQASALHSEGLQRHVNTVDAYGRKVTETADRMVDACKAQVGAQIQMSRDRMQLKDEEHVSMVAARARETDQEVARMTLMSGARATAHEKRLDLMRKAAEQKDANERKEIERAELRATKELERQQKRNEIEHERAMKEADRVNQQGVKELERLEKRGQIDAAGRAQVMEELKVEMDRYNTEFALAKDAMNAAIQKGGRCDIRHTAPKINWGPPPSVVPGSISWEMRR